MPVEDNDFPYLIPDDRTAGKALYSASIVLNKDYIELLDEVQLDVLKNLLLPGDNRFIESPDGRHVPHDLLVLGNLETDADNLTIEPSIISLKAGGTQSFTAIARDGKAASVQWSVSNPVSPLVTGSITAEGGKYTMPAPALMGKEQQSIIVTAQYVGQGGRTQKSSALVRGMFESMSISPRVSNSDVGPGAATVELRADSLGGGTLQWPTLLPSEGSLRVVDNNHAIYTPPVEQAQPLAIQTIRVTDSLTKETIDAVIVLIKSAHTLPVDPPFVAAVDATTPIQLRADTDDPQDLRWTVIGEGSVDENGIFTPPEQPASRATVVRCSYVVGGVVRYSGLSVIQLSQLSIPDPSWSELQDFSIIASGQDQCYSNGFQQIPVIIKIETKPVKIGGKDVYIPVSDAHLSTLRLVDRVSNVPVPFIEVYQEGIEYQSGVNWAVSKKRNRFSLYSGSNKPASAVALPTPKNNGVRYRELWIHLAAEGSRTFYAQFTSDKGTHNSNDSHEEGFEVTVRGIRPSPPPLNHYELKRQRAWQDKDGVDGPPLDGEPEADVFSYYRQSIDYWRLSYHRLGMYPVLFVNAKVEDNISTIQWESELIDETYFSYTGYAFNPANNEFSDSFSPEGLSFDPYLWGLTRLRSIALQSSFITNMEPASGELMISLHRTDEMEYWYDALAEGDKRRLYRQHLDKHVKVVLIDQEGNRHALKFGFDSPTNHNSRNKVLLSRF